MGLRFQFGLPNVACAAFWLSIWGSIWKVLPNAFGDEPQWPSPWGIILFLALFILFIWAPVLAAASLLRRNGYAMIIGGLAATAVLMVVSLLAAVLPHS
jgi:hypothetical protein